MQLSIHIYEIAEEISQLHFESNQCVSSSKVKTNTTRMSAVISFGVALKRYQIIPSSWIEELISCHYSPTDFISSQTALGLESR
jgi:hypothetical protein